MATPSAYSHTRIPMIGRDPRQGHRSATPLELLFDLTFVIGFGVAANELGHALVEDHIVEGLIGFTFATFAVSWAWINHTWFASAFDTDDWVYRLATMVQMIGVLVLALGLSDMYASLVAGDILDNRVMVFGYVIMRIPMIFQWWRASRESPAHRSSAQAYILSLSITQVCWVGMALVDMPIPLALALGGLLMLVEMSGPLVAEKRFGGTPWHAHHIAERYGLLVIIALGEGMIGTMASMTALVGADGPGWSSDVIVVGFAGVALTFGAWWCYFVVPAGDLLSAYRERSFGWGYAHIVLFGAVVAIGAGLHVGGYYLEQHSELAVPGTVLSVAIPVAIYIGTLFGLYAGLTRTFDPRHTVVFVGCAVVIVAAVAMAYAGVSLEWCLLVLAATPWVIVVGYERHGHQHTEQVVTTATSR